MVKPILWHNGWTHPPRLNIIRFSLAEKSDKFCNPFNDFSLFNDCILTSQYVTPYCMCNSYLAHVTFHFSDSMTLYFFLKYYLEPVAYKPINHLYLSSTTTKVWTSPISSSIRANTSFHWLLIFLYLNHSCYFILSSILVFSYLFVYGKILNNR